MPFIATATRPGANNGGSDKRELFLKQFAGEVLTTFKNATATLDKHIVRTISSGKSASFPVSGVASAAYHTPGTNILDGDNGLLSNILAGEKVISIDDLLISATFIANIDEAMNHYDVRSIYSGEVGKALALRWDSNVLRKMIQAARAAATLTGGSSGTVLNKGATVATTASVLAAAISEAAMNMDKKNIPEDERFAFLLPDQYHLLSQTATLVNKDYAGENGNIASGKIYQIDGVTLVKTNQLPQTNDTVQASGDKNDYRGDYRNTVCVVAHKSAVGTVKLLDLSMEMEYKMELQGTALVAKYAVGHGVLRPESAIEITKV